MAVTKKWFFLVENEVQGPFVETEIKDLSKKHAAGLVWGQGLSEWIKPDEWEKTMTDLQGILASLQTDMTPQWRIKQGEFEAGPFIYDQLIQVLKAHPNAGQCLLYQESEATWKPIFDYPTIVEEVGISRRLHERVPISGFFKYDKDGARYEALISSISEGGISILEAQNVVVGDILKGVIESPQLPTYINCSCEALYQQDDSAWGLRFSNLPQESQSIVIAYTKKFLK